MAQIGKSVSFNDSNRPTMTDNQSAWLGINSSELLPRKSTEDRATGGRIPFQRHCHLQCSIELFDGSLGVENQLPRTSNNSISVAEELIESPSTGRTLSIREPLAMTSTNSISVTKKREWDELDSGPIPLRRNVPFLFSPSKVVDARVATPPSLRPKRYP